MLSNSRLLVSKIILAVFLYLACVLLGDSMLQSSLLGILLFVITLKIYLNDYKQLWFSTWRIWLLVAGVVIISVVVSDVFNRSAKGMYDLIRATLLFFVAATIVANAGSENATKTIKHSWLLVTVLVAVSYSVLAYMNGDWPLRYNPLISQYFSGIHEYANVISIALLGLVGLWVVEKERFSWVQLCCVFCLSFVLLMTDSRGAYLALFFCALYTPCHFLSQLRPVWWGGALLVLAMFLYLSYIHLGTSVFGIDIPASFLERVELSKSTTYAIFDSPWLGYGLNTYKYIGSQFGWGTGYVMPHNIYLELLFSTGLVGTFILFFCFIKLYNNTRIETEALCRVNKYWLLFAHLLLVYLAFRGLTELRLGYKTWGLLMISLGILAGVKLRSSKQPEEKIGIVND